MYICLCQNDTFFVIFMYDKNVFHYIVENVIIIP